MKVFELELTVISNDSIIVLVVLVYYDKWGGLYWSFYMIGQYCFIGRSWILSTFNKNSVKWGNEICLLFGG